MRQISQERVKDQKRLCEQGNLLGTVQEIRMWPYIQIVYTQPRICPGEWNAQTSLGFWDTNGSHNFGQTTRP